MNTTIKTKRPRVLTTRDVYVTRTKHGTINFRVTRPVTKAHAAKLQTELGYGLSNHSFTFIGDRNYTWACTKILLTLNN